MKPAAAKLAAEPLAAKPVAAKPAKPAFTFPATPPTFMFPDKAKAPKMATPTALTPALAPSLTHAPAVVAASVTAGAPTRGGKVDPEVRTDCCSDGCCSLYAGKASQWYNIGRREGRLQCNAKPGNRASFIFFFFNLVCIMQTDIMAGVNKYYKLQLIDIDGTGKNFVLFAKYGRGMYTFCLFLFY